MSEESPLCPGGSARLRSQRGVAIFMAMVAAIVVALLAAALIGYTSRRFFLSAFRTDRVRSVYASEAAVKYAFVRLEKDTVSDGLPTPPNGFRDDVRFDNNPPHVVSSTSDKVRIRCGSSAWKEVDPDKKNVRELKVGGKDTWVAVRFEAATGNYRVCGYSDYGPSA